MSRVSACRLVGLNRSSLNYQSKRPDDSTHRGAVKSPLTQNRARTTFDKLLDVGDTEKMKIGIPAKILTRMISEI